MRRLIPAPLIAVVADAAAASETHATLDSLFQFAGVPGDPPDGSKHAKALAWLRQTNKDASVTDPLAVVGRLIEGYLEEPLDPNSTWDDSKRERNEKILKVLAHLNLQYVPGGKIAGALAAPSKTLAELIRGTDFTAINHEFNRAYESVDIEPREAVSAACNILESICKTYIEDEQLEMPAKQDLQPIWSTVRKHLGFDPGQIADRDLQEILSGLIAVVNGIGALRTHASSAHGAGRKAYRLEGRHARLAVHAAHTVALFVLESWDKRRQQDSAGVQGRQFEPA